MSRPSCIGIVVAISLSYCHVAAAKTYNVRNEPYNAVGDGTADDTNAIQLAIDQAAFDGGGTVYIPAGSYRLGSTHDDHFGSGITNAHLLVDQSGVSIEGDSASVDGRGTVLIGDSNSAAVLMIAKRTASPHGTVIRDLLITRAAPAVAQQLLSGAVGILFDNFGTKESWAWNCRLVNLQVESQYDGVRATYRSSTDLLNPQLLSLEKVDVRSCDRYGAYFEIGGEIRVANSVFRGCGQVVSGAGLRLDRRVDGIGTTLVSNCDFFGNEVGMEFIGVEEPSRDVHITGCQFDLSDSFGVLVSKFQNVVIAGCSFTADAGANVNAAALKCVDGKSLSVSGVTIRGSGATGLALVDCDTAAISALTVDWNGQLGGTPYAIVLNGGVNIALNGVVMTSRPAMPTNGIWIQGGPRNVFGTGIVFSDGFGTDPGESVMFGNVVLPQLGSGEFRFWNPESASTDVIVLQ